MCLMDDKVQGKLRVTLNLIHTMSWPATPRFTAAR